MLSEALIMNEESQNLNTSNLSETFEYFVMIKFKFKIWHYNAPFLLLAFLGTFMNESLLMD